LVDLHVELDGPDMVKAQLACMRELLAYAGFENMCKRIFSAFYFTVNLTSM
jgi:hypothetical protein